MASTFIQRTTDDFIKLLMYFLVCGKCLPPIFQTICTLRPLPPFWNYKHLDPLVASLDLYSVCIRKYILLGGSPRLHMPFYFTAKASYSFQTWSCHGHHLRRDEIKVFFLFPVYHHLCSHAQTEAVPENPDPPCSWAWEEVQWKARCVRWRPQDSTQAQPQDTCC